MIAEGMSCIHIKYMLGVNGNSGPFWHEKSRPAGDKQDIVRQRMGLKNHIQHPKQILGKTQTELYLDFCKS